MHFNPTKNTEKLKENFLELYNFSLQDIIQDLGLGQSQTNTGFFDHFIRLQ